MRTRPASPARGQPPRSVEGWLADAGPLLDQAAGEDYGDRDYARAAVEYYVDEVIRSADRRAEFCGARIPF